MNAPEWPDKEEIRRVLVGLSAGIISPAQAEDWANKWVMSEDPDDDVDDVVWDVLIELSGAAIEVSPGQLLHSREDYDSWLTALDTPRRNGPQDIS